MKATGHWLLACMLVCGLALAAAEVAAPAELARSSLLTVSGSAGPGDLKLWVRRSADPAALVVSEFAAAVDGKNAPVTRSPEGYWSVPLASLSSGEHHVAVTVGHDGIRELLEGQFTVAASSAPAGGIAGLGGNHKQLLWWALNIGIVLAAAIAISRRMS